MALWTPAGITTALWLDADDPDTIVLSGSDVISIHDKSASSVTFSQDIGTPTYSNGRVIFDGVTNMASDNSVNLGDFSALFLVFGSNIKGTQRVLSQGVLDNGTSVWELLCSSFGHVSYRVNGTNTYRVDSVSDYPTDGSISLYAGVNNAPMSIRFNGEEQDTTPSPTAQDTNTEPVYLGGTPDGSQLNGEFCESIVVADPTPELIEKIEGYLAWKWGRESNLPTGHPHKAAAPAAETPTGLVVALTTANSITWGWDA